MLRFLLDGLARNTENEQLNIFPITIKTICALFSWALPHLREQS